MKPFILLFFIALAVKVNSQCAALSLDIGGPSTNICDGDLLPITSNVSWPGPGTLSYLWSTGDTTSTITISPTQSTNVSLTVSVNGCDTTENIQIIVNSNSSSSSNFTICADQLPYIWNGLTFSSAGSQTATLINSNGCDSLASLNLTVNPNPTVTFSSLPNVCSDDTLDLSPFVSPTGGLFSGNGVSNNDLFASNAVIGNNNITYTYTNSFGCSNNASNNIFINEIPQGVLFAPTSGSYNPNLSSTTYQGQDYWKNCVFTGTSNLDFTVLINNASNNSNQTTYSIDWGDGTPILSNYPIYQAGNPSTFINHTYTNAGVYEIELTIVDNATGCTNKFKKNLFWGSNPGGGVTSPGNTSALCSPSLVNFSLDAGPTVNGAIVPNPPGTAYSITSNDPTFIPINLFHPSPSSLLTNYNFSHTFSASSCGYTALNGAQANSFDIICVASNACGQVTSQFGDIVVSEPPSAHIGTNIDTIGCQQISQFTFIDSSFNGFSVTSAPYTCDSSVVRFWTITPNTYTLTNGSLGDPFLQTSGSNQIQVIFDSSGTYSIELSIQSYCGNSSITNNITQNICIDSAAHSSFIIDTNIGCAPLTVNASNTSLSLNDCDPEFTWNATHIGSSGCSNTGAWNHPNPPDDNNASFLFTESGKYVISLKAKNKCDSIVFYDTITVKGIPEVSINPISI